MEPKVKLKWLSAYQSNNMKHKECEWLPARSKVMSSAIVYQCKTCKKRIGLSRKTLDEQYNGDIQKFFAKFPSRCSGIEIPAKNPPGIIAKTFHYASAVSKWIAAGRPKRTDEETAQIYAICETCKPHFDAKHRSCKLCGCNVNRAKAALANKIRMATEACPLGLWPIQKIDVVYPIAGGFQGKKKIGSKWNNNELRYSLRSLEKNLTNLGRVFIIGHKPEWLTGVVHIPAEDVHRSNKDANLIDKVLLACKSGVSKTFLRLSDDQCLLQPWNGSGVWHMGEASGKKGGKWWKRMQRTCDYLQSRGRPTYFYDCHAPAQVDRDAFVKVANEADYQPPPGMCINTLYFNSIDIPREPIAGRKVAFHYAANLGKLRKNTQGKLFLGYSEAGTNDAMKQFLAESFPTPSKYEIESDVSLIEPASLVTAIANGSCSDIVYHEILAEIKKRRPCNVLVFGCGADSLLWKEANEGGRTVLIENNRKWARSAQKLGCEVIMTTYSSSRDVDYPDEPPPAELQDVLQQSWDVVFIDGPKGNRASAPGRELPIRWTSQLPGSPTVFLHDCRRRGEKRHAAKYLQKPSRIVDSHLAVWQPDASRAAKPNYAWTYWDGPMPAWIELCLETMKKNIPGINILTPATFASLYAKHRGPGDPQDLLSVLPASSLACQRSDIIRVWLLKTLGGLWVDADCVVLQDVRELCQKYFDGKDLVTYKYKKRFSVNAMLMSKPGGQIISEYARLQQEVLRQEHDGLSKKSFGPPLLQKAITSVGADKVGVVPTLLVDPARGGREQDYLAKGKLPEDCVCVMLRARVGKNKSRWTREQWLDPNCYLSTIFRCALEM